MNVLANLITSEQLPEKDGNDLFTRFCQKTKEAKDKTEFIKLVAEICKDESLLKKFTVDNASKFIEYLYYSQLRDKNIFADIYDYIYNLNPEERDIEGMGEIADKNADKKMMLLLRYLCETYPYDHFSRPQLIHTLKILTHENAIKNYPIWVLLDCCIALNFKEKKIIDEEKKALDLIFHRDATGPEWDRILSNTTFRLHYWTKLLSTNAKIFKIIRYIIKVGSTKIGREKIDSFESFARNLLSKNNIASEEELTHAQDFNDRNQERINSSQTQPRFF
jgi:hypothetical protein